MFNKVRVKILLLHLLAITRAAAIAVGNSRLGGIYREKGEATAIASFFYIYVLLFHPNVSGTIKRSNLRIYSKCVIPHNFSVGDPPISRSELRQ